MFGVMLNADRGFLFIAMAGGRGVYYNLLVDRLSEVYNTFILFDEGILPGWPSFFGT